jgi:DNA-binding XRE family transcriptional regulator
MNEKLKAARMACKLTQVQISDSLNIDYKTYQRWERGHARPSLPNLGKLCRWFGKSREELGYDR